MNLYEIAELENQIEGIAAENGEIPDEKLQELILAQTNAVQKIENVCKYVRNLEAFAALAKAEEERIAGRRKRAENIVASIKEYITPYVTSKTKIEVGTFVLSIRESKAVTIQNENEVPAKYKTIETMIKISKTDIKKDIEQKINVPGAILETRKNLQIK